MNMSRKVLIIISAAILPSILLGGAGYHVYYAVKSSPDFQPTPGETCSGATSCYFMWLGGVLLFLVILTATGFIVYSRRLEKQGHKSGKYLKYILGFLYTGIILLACFKLEIIKRVVDFLYFLDHTPSSPILNSVNFYLALVIILVILLVSLVVTRKG